MNNAEFKCNLLGYLPRLWTFALRLTRNKHDAEDLVQRTCLRALERSCQLESLNALLSWLYSILYSTWVNELKARKVRDRYNTHLDDEVIDNLPDPTLLSPEDAMVNSQIVRAVMRLSENQRAVILLIGVEGLSYSEAAEALGIPIGTVMSRLSRARQTVGALLAADFRDRA